MYFLNVCVLKFASVAPLLETFALNSFFFFCSSFITDSIRHITRSRSKSYAYIMIFNVLAYIAFFSAFSLQEIAVLIL